MAALTANKVRPFSARPSPRTYIVKNAITVYQGSFVGLEQASGHIVALDDAADRAFLGIAQSKVVGDGTKTVGVWCIDAVLEKAAVTGYSAVTKNGQLVYAGTDDDSLTMTRPADDAIAVGVTVRFVSSGVGDVALFGADTYAAMMIAGSTKKRIILANIDLASITGAGDVITGYKLWGHGKIVALGVIVGKPATTAAKLATLNAEIGGTNVTGGTAALTSANMTPLGAIVEGAAPTAANEFFDGDLLDIESASVTAFVEGSITVYIDVEYLP